MPAAASASARPATSGASGPDDDEVDPLVARRGDERGRVVDGDVEQPRVAARCRRCRARTAARALRRARERAHDRVLAAARADDEDLACGCQLTRAQRSR